MLRARANCHNFALQNYKHQTIMATSTLFLILIAVLVVACIIYSFARKLSGALKGRKLIIDNDTVTVADDEIQDFMAEVEEEAEKYAVA